MYIYVYIYIYICIDIHVFIYGVVVETQLEGVGNIAPQPRQAPPTLDFFE